MVLSNSNIKMIEFIEEINSKKTKRELGLRDKIKSQEWFFTFSGKLPNDWIEVNFMDVTWLITCGVAKRPSYVEKGIPFLSAQNARPFSTNLNKIKYISEKEFKQLTVGGKPERNDILYTRVGNCGEAAKIKYDFEFAIYVSLTLIKPINELIDSDYLVAFLNGYYGKVQANVGAIGIGLKNLNVDNVRKYKIPLPPKLVQQAIVSKIEELFSELDKGIETLHLAQQQLKTYRQSVLKWAFEGKLTQEWRNNQQKLLTSKDFITEIIKRRELDYKIKLETWNNRKFKSNGEKIPKPQKPSNIDPKNDLYEGLVEKENLPTEWEVIPLVFVSDNQPNSIVDGPFGSSINVNEDYIEEGVPVIRMVNIRPFRFVQDQMKFIKESKFQSLRRHNILPKDVLIAKVGATIGDCCIYPINQPEAMLSTTGSCRIRLDKNVMNAKFLEYNIFFHKNTLKEIASQTAQPFLNMKVLKSFPIVLPTIEEQDNIVQAIESRLSVADKLEESINQSLQQAEALRQSILKRAFEGRLI